MKKSILKFVVLLFIAVSMSSCATVFGGRVGTCQRVKPSAGSPSRQIRAGALIADILLFWPGLIVDFATCSIYKPCDPKPTASLKK